MGGVLPGGADDIVPIFRKPGLLCVGALLVSILA